MGYILQLGYPKQIIDQNGYPEFEGFEIATVNPFKGSSMICGDPDAQKIYTGLDISPFEYGDDVLEYDPADTLPPAVDDNGKVKADIDVTINYSERIGEIVNTHLSNLHGMRASEAAALLIELIAGLGVEEPSQDYWSPSDGNIRLLTETLLDWTFQHPDATFRSIG